MYFDLVFHKFDSDFFYISDEGLRDSINLNLNAIFSINSSSSGTFLTNQPHHSASTRCCVVWNLYKQLNFLSWALDRPKFLTAWQPTQPHIPWTFQTQHFFNWTFKPTLFSVFLVQINGLITYPNQTMSSLISSSPSPTISCQLPSSIDTLNISKSLHLLSIPSTPNLV